MSGRDADPLDPITTVLELDERLREFTSRLSQTPCPARRKTTERVAYDRSALLRLVHGTLGQMKSVEPIDVAVDHRLLPEREPNLPGHVLRRLSFLGSIIAKVSPSKLRTAIPRTAVAASVA